MEQTANALPPVTLGQYKGLPVTRRVRPDRSRRCF